MDYKLSTVLYGHTLDVRGLAVTSEGFIVSSSRDNTARLWKMNSENNGYTQVQLYKGHKNYVACCLALKHSAILPNGFILTGGHDKLICGYNLMDTDAILYESSHTDTVCKLNLGILPNTFISSSWDSTARLWEIVVDSNKTIKMELIALCNGHSSGIWSAIQLSTKEIVTCSADKTIIVHGIVPGNSDKRSQILKKLTGHIDCVRDLAEFKQNEFLSCSNDATVKRWNVTTGDCLETFHGHPNYIYCMTVHRDINVNNTIVVTGGEDRYINVWKVTKEQVLLQPADSIWCVAVLPNLDIVAGSSDGLIRIFSADPNRYTSEEGLVAFQEQVDHVHQIAQEKVGGIKVDSLPGPEILQKPGKNDGQIIMVNENGKPICYKWLSTKSKWDKIGDVLSGSSSTKNTFEGKEYDYVWNVDIDDDVPPLKLAFNHDQDPWTEAQKFIHKNNLPQSYLETVANFIVNNSHGASASGPSNNQEYVDPYTGGARYVPNPSTTNKLQFACFPQTDYLKFDQSSTANIISKVQEFNEKPGLVLKLNESQIECLVKFLDPNVIPDQESVNLLLTLFDWPIDILFPILDITRLSVLNKDVNVMMCSTAVFMPKILMVIHTVENPINLMMAIRCLCNLMQHEAGELLVVRYYEEIVSFIQELKSETLQLKHVQVAVATFLLNISIMIQQSEDPRAIQFVANILYETCPKFIELEALYRCFVGIGTLTCLENPPLLTEQIRDFVELIASGEASKISLCCQQIMEILDKTP